MVRRLQALGAPTEGSLAAWPDQQPPQHVHHERYDDKDDEYLFCSQAIRNYARGSFFALSFTYVEYF
jgi:hypothetical protein